MCDAYSHRFPVTGGLTTSWVLPALLLFAASLAQAKSTATEVCGTFRLPTTWTKAESPYLITGDVYIPNGSRLTIEPGAIVRFARPKPCEGEEILPQADWADSQFVSIKVEGNFFAVGTPAERILFEPEGYQMGHIGWDGIRFQGQNSHRVEIGFAIFRGAHKALLVRQAEFFVHHNLFEDNNIGLWLGRWANLVVVNNNFIGHRSAGLLLESAQPRIVSNIFYRNRGYGVWGDRNPATDMQYNAFFANRDGHCYQCPAWALQLDFKNSRGDSSDRFNNLHADPFFENSSSFNEALARDMELNTPKHRIRDTVLAEMEYGNRKGVSQEARQMHEFKPLGLGPYRLSIYSRLIDAGHPGEAMLDSDGTSNDIGMHGGHMGRLTRSPI